MLLKAKITAAYNLIKDRFFQSNLFSRQAANLVQFHSGGDDYNPAINAEGLAGSIGDNPANGVIFAWRDDITRKSLAGEKRIYSVKVNEDTNETLTAAEIYLKNDGSIEISGAKDLNITIIGNAVFNVSGDTNIDTSGVLVIDADGGIQSTGDWQHSGSFKASHIEAEDGASATFTNSVTAQSGIVTGGA